MKKKKTPLTGQEHAMMLAEMSKVTPGKSARAFHKKYKKYGYGVDLFDRYPNLPLHVSILALVSSLLAFAATIIRLVLTFT